MFTMKIVDSDAFLEMPLSSQCLYFHLNMRADDDGFVGNPRKIMRMIQATEDDLKILLAKRFLIMFEDSVVVIKHWWMHNTLSKDRYSETAYIDDKSQLYVKPNKAYTLNPDCTDKLAVEEHKKEKKEYSEARVKRMTALKDSELPTHFNRVISNLFNNERCPVCNCVMDINDTQTRPTVQHNIPISKGGKHELTNISVICQSCNCSLNNQHTPPYNTDIVIQKWNNMQNKKAPLLEREPANDLEKVEKVYLENYKQLYEQGVVRLEKPVINWTVSRKLTKDCITKYGLETILNAVRKSKDNKFCVTKGYVLTTILSAGILSQLINSTDGRIDNDSEVGEINF